MKSCFQLTVGALRTQWPKVHRWASLQKAVQTGLAPATVSQRGAVCDAPSLQPQQERDTKEKPSIQFLPHSGESMNSANLACQLHFKRSHFQCQGEPLSSKRGFASNAGDIQAPSKLSQYSEIIRLRAAAYLKVLPKKAYLRSLKNVLNTVPELEGEVEAVMQRIEELHLEACKKHRGLAKDDRGASHLQMASLVLASYRAILPHLAHNRAATIDLIKEPVGAAAADTVNFTSRFVLFLSLDKFAHVSRGLEYLSRDFGASFETVQSKEPGFHSLKVTRCLYNTFFELEGAPELTQLFCAFDRMWFDHIRPSKHAIEFVRPKTLADGALSCDFVVRRRT